MASRQEKPEERPPPTVQQDTLKKIMWLSPALGETIFASILQDPLGT